MTTDTELIRALLKQVSYLKAETDPTAYDAAWLALNRLEAEADRLRRAVEDAYKMLPPTGVFTVRRILYAALTPEQVGAGT